MSDDTVEVNQEAVNQGYEAAYSEESFWKKIAATAIRAGKEILLMVLTLYYAHRGFRPSGHTGNI